MKNIIDKINEKVRTVSFFEFSMLSYQGGILVLAGSEDFTYYHNVEIIFKEVFSFIGNLQWKVDTRGNCIEIATGDEAFELNNKYNVEVGNSVFKFKSSDAGAFYVIAESIEFEEKLVKYYAPL